MPAGYHSCELKCSQDLPPDIRFLLIARAVPSKVPTGHEICQQGDDAASVWLLQDGEGCASCPHMLPVPSADGGANTASQQRQRPPQYGCRKMVGSGSPPSCLPVVGLHTCGYRSGPKIGCVRLRLPVRH